MGTRFAGHRVRKADWTTFQARLREYYLAEHPLPAVARELAAKVFVKSEGERGDAFVKALDLLHKACVESGSPATDRPIAALQLFDRRSTWLFRILERDWFGDNALNEHGVDWLVQDIWFDDHTDMTPAMRRLRPLVERVDADINARRYFVAPILSEDDVLSVFHGEYRRLREPDAAKPITDTCESFSVSFARING